MKRNALTTAIVAGICGVAGFAGLGQAVDLSPDALGQALVYPYYTVNEAQQTMLVVDEVNPVKVRFLDGRDASAVVDFDLFVYRTPTWLEPRQPFVGALDVVGFDIADEPPRLGDWFDVGDPGTKD